MAQKSINKKTLRDAFGITELDLVSLVLKRIVQKLKVIYPVEFLNEYPIPSTIMNRLGNDISFDKKLRLCTDYYDTIAKLNKKDFIALCFKELIPPCRMITYVDERTDFDALRAMLKRKYPLISKEDLEDLPESGYIFIYQLLRKDVLKLPNFTKNKDKIIAACKIIYKDKVSLISEVDGIYDYGIVRLRAQFERSDNFYIEGGIDLFRQELIKQIRTLRGNAGLIA